VFNAIPHANPISVSVSQPAGSPGAPNPGDYRLLATLGLKEVSARSVAQPGRITLLARESVTAETLALQILTLLRGVDYSIVLLGKLPSDPDSPSTTGVMGMLIPDDTLGPPYGKGRLRILIAAPTAAKYDVYIVQPGTDLQAVVPTFAGLGFRQYTTYLDLPIGLYRVIATEAGSKANVVAEYKAVATNGEQLAALDLQSRESLTLALTPTDVSGASLNLFPIVDHQ
jgi:hypothetical protein